MSYSYNEIYYTSSQYGIFSESDGFGVRTITKGQSPSIVDRIKERNLFYYQSGLKQMAGTHDLMENPTLVNEFPITFAHFSIEEDGNKLFCLIRNVFVGRDYGWYLEETEESARSGNTFAHVLIFNQPISRAVFQKIPDRLFLPHSYVNHSNNQELRELLTGKPIFLAPKQIPSQDGEFPGLSPHAAKILVGVFASFQHQKKILVRIQDNKTASALATIMSYLPSFLACEVAFITNYHEYNIDTSYTLTFVNEHYLNTSIANLLGEDFLIFDFINDTFSQIPGSLFIDRIHQLAEGNRARDLMDLVLSLEQIIEYYDVQIDFDNLIKVHDYLYKSRLEEEQASPVKIIQSIMGYPLLRSFRTDMIRQIKESFLAAVEEKNYRKVANSLTLVQQIEQNNNSNEIPIEIKNEFSKAFFHDSFAHEMARLSYEFNLEGSLVFKFLSLESVLENWKAFANNHRVNVKFFTSFALFFYKELPDSTQKEIFTYCLEEEKFSSDFWRQISVGWTKEEKWSFLEEYEYFASLPFQKHNKYFFHVFEELLDDYYQHSENENVPYYLNWVLRFPKQYGIRFFTYLAKKVLDNASSQAYQSLVNLLSDYSTLIQDGFIDPNKYDEKLINLLRFLMKYFPKENTISNKWLLDALQEYTASLEKNTEVKLAELPIYSQAGLYYHFSSVIYKILATDEFLGASPPELPTFPQKFTPDHNLKLSGELAEFVLDRVPPVVFIQHPHGRDWIRALLLRFYSVASFSTSFFETVWHKYQITNQEHLEFLQKFIQLYLLTFWEPFQDDTDSKKWRNHYSSTSIQNSTEKILNKIKKENKRLFDNVLEELVKQEENLELAQYISQKYQSFKDVLIGKLGSKMKNISFPKRNPLRKRNEEN